MFKGDMIVPHQNLGRCHFLKKLTIGLLRTLEGESYRGPSFILVSNHDQHSGWSSSSSSSSLLRRVEEEEAVGRYSAEERRERIDKYRSKRNQRNFDKKITYACRKTLADSRPRVKGRFARNSSDDGAAAEVEVSPATNNNVPEWWPAVQEALARQEQEAAGLHLCDTADDDLLAAYLGVSIDLYSTRGH